MIIEIEKRNIVTSQTKKECGTRQLCKTSFITETIAEADLVMEFVAHVLSMNKTEEET